MFICIINNEIRFASNITCNIFMLLCSLKNEGGEDQQTSNTSSTTFYEEKMFCHHCDDSLAGHRYVLRDDHPYCIKCYENVFANNCDECGKIIGIDSKVIIRTKKIIYLR